MADTHTLFTTLDADVIAQLARSTWNEGVLSIYEPISYEQPDNWLTHARSHLARITSQTPHPEHLLVQAACERAMDVLEGVSGSAAPGRSIAAFVSLDEPHNDVWIGTDLPVRASVTLSRYPQVSQLLSLAQLATPTGIVRIAQQTAAIDEWRGGTLIPVDEHRVVVDTSGQRRKQGPATAGDGHLYRTAHHKDRFEHTLEQHGHEALTTWLIERLTSTSRQRGWHRMVLFGPNVVKQQLRDRFDRAGTTIIDAGTHELVNAPRADLTQRVKDALQHHIDVDAHKLVGSILSGQATNAVVGAEHTKQALQYRHAATLVLSDTNAADDEAERMIRQVLGTGGDVIVLRDEPARELMAAGGVAALLRL